MRERLRRTLGGAGRTLIVVGLLILGFVAYQLWGTGLVTARDQHKLKNEFAAELAHAGAPSSSSAPSTSAPSTTVTTVPKSTSTSTPPTTAASSPVVGSSRAPAVADGAVVGIIHLPWSSYAIVQGTTRNDLEKGPGHYPATVYPGQLGNAAIAGHRTTYLHPFYDADSLHIGSEIRIDMLWGHYTYRVTKEPYAVSPSDVDVVATHDPAHATLTLTTCNPKYSARQRLVVQATLVAAKSEKPKPFVKPKPPAGQQLASDGPAPDTTDASLKDGLSGDTASRTPTLVWGVLLLLVGALWWWGYRHWRHPFTWFGGLVPFLPVLFAFYVYLERVLPAGF
jgi:sortase A